MDSNATVFRLRGPLTRPRVQTRNQRKLLKSGAWQREHRELVRTPGGSIYYEFSTHEELRELILSIHELRELVRPRIPFLPMREIVQVKEGVTREQSGGMAR